MSSNFKKFFPTRVLLAVLSSMSVMWIRAAHSSINVPPNCVLSEGMFCATLEISLSEKYLH